MNPTTTALPGVLVLEHRRLVIHDPVAVVVYAATAIRRSLHG